MAESTEETYESAFLEHKNDTKLYHFNTKQVEPVRNIKLFDEDVFPDTLRSRSQHMSQFYNMEVHQRGWKLYYTVQKT